MTFTVTSNRGAETSSDRRPRIAVVGVASWDRFLVVGRYPSPGQQAIVRRTASLPGGTSTNSAVALARLGAEVAVVALVGDDDDGRAIRTALATEGVDVRWLSTIPGGQTNLATVVVSREPPDKTMFWRAGVALRRGAKLDIDAIFGHDVVLLDVNDAPLRRFLLDLPAHTRPSARLLGTLFYLDPAELPDAFELVMRHDAIVGSARELQTVTGADDLDAAIDRVQSAMPGANLRACVVTLGPRGALAFDRTDCWRTTAFPVAAVDPTGAGDAFAAGIAWSLALRWAWPAALRFAGAVAALSTRELGAQTALPSLEEVLELVGPALSPPGPEDSPCPASPAPDRDSRPDNEV